MSSRGLRRLPIHPHISDQLQRHGISTAKDILSKTHFELLQQVNIPWDDARGLLHSVARAIAPKPSTALDLLAKWDSEASFLRTTLAPLDSALRGGIPVSSVTEVCGPAGCGKTQMCAMLAVMATLPKHMGGLNGSVLYIDTEHALTAERLVEIATSRFPSHFAADKQRVHDCVERIFIIREMDSHSLLSRLERLQEDVIECSAKLIVLDSIAALVRKEFDGTTAERTALLTKQAAVLKRLAEGFHIPVIVTNHVTTRFSTPTAYSLGDKTQPTMDGDESELDVSTTSDPHSVTAALGVVWGHCVNTRIILQYFREPIRELLIAKSPVSSFCTIRYIVDRTGLRAQGGGAVPYGGADPCLKAISVRHGMDMEISHVP